MPVASLNMERMSSRESVKEASDSRRAAGSRPASIASEASAEYKPPSILRRTSQTSSLGDHHSTSSSLGTAPPSPVSRRGSRIRFVEASDPVASGSSSSMTEPSSETQPRSRRTRPPSAYIRPPSPSDFEPRPLPTLRYVDGRAQSEIHVPRPKSITSEASSSSSRKRRSVASGSSSRRASARFSILSDQDLDMLEQMGGIPDLDDFLPSPSPTRRSTSTSASPSSSAAAPPRAPLPTLELDADLIVHETPVPAAVPTRRRALSPITGEDEATPIARPFPTFETGYGDQETPQVSDSAYTKAHSRGQASIVSLTPLLGFPVPPARNLSLESVQSLLVDEIDKVGRSAPPTSLLHADAVALQPAPELGSASRETTPQIADEDANGIILFGSPEIDDKDVHVPALLDAGRRADQASHEEEESQASAPDSTLESDTEAICLDRWPGSPSISDMLFDLKRAVALCDPQDDDDEFEFDYHTPLHEAAVRSGIISSRSKLIWTDKPKRRSFMHRRLSTRSRIKAERERTGWSGSESEEEEFNAVLADIAARRRLTLAPVQNDKTTRPRSSYLTPSPRPGAGQRNSLYRMSTLSTPSSSGASASSFELLTPDPHRSYSYSFDSPLSAKSKSNPNTKGWTTSRPPAPATSALGFPTPPLTSRRSSPQPKPTRKVRGWGKPETLLEHDEPPAILSSSSDEEEDDDCREGGSTSASEAERPSTPETASSHSQITITIESPFGPSPIDDDVNDAMLIDETEPEFDDEAFARKLAIPSRYLGIPF